VTRRLVAVLVPRAGADGFPDEPLRAAMVEDVYETVAALELVEPALALDADDPARDILESLVWPGTAVVHLPPSKLCASRTWHTLDALVAAGADQVTVVAGDAPDLPGLLIGKLHRALGAADVAVLPGSDGGVVGLATHAPLPAWLVAAPAVADLDHADPVTQLREAARRRTAVSVGPGWHRVRTPADLARLDPGLEGWEITRELLGGAPGR
jgi:glycosyltransferase A (GT-A) superfamily protein (DUF2064 family)